MSNSVDEQKVSGSALVVYHYPPRLHKHVDIIEREEDGRPVYWFKDARSNRYFRAGKRERDIILLIDGTRTLSEICRVIRDEMNVSIRVHQLAQIISKLDSIGLIDGVEDPKLKKRSARMGPRTVTLVNPDRFFAKLDKYLFWIFTRPFVFISLSLMALVMAEMFRRPGEVAAYGEKVWRTYGLIGHATAVLLIVSLHEIGHGLTCKRFGGRVTDMGIAFVGVILPAGYCNVSDIYLFRNKRHQVYVLFAGIYTQFLMATLAAALWLLLVPGTIVSDLFYLIFWGATLTTILNLIPLLKLDGYYILTILLNQPNLQKRAFKYTTGILRRVAFGEKMKSRETTLARKNFYIVYTFAYALFIVIFPLYLSIRFYDYLTSNYGRAGILLAIAAAASAFRFALIPLFRSIKVCFELIGKTDAPILSRLRAGFVVSLPAAGCLFLMFGYWTERIWADCAISVEPDGFAPVTLKSAGVVKKLFVSDRSKVEKDQPIAIIESRDIDLELARLDGESSSIDRRMQEIRERISEQQARLEQSRHELLLRAREAAELTAEEEALKKGDPDALGYPAEINVLRAHVTKFQSLDDYHQERVRRYETLSAAGVASPLLTEQSRFERSSVVEQKSAAQKRLDKAVIEHRRASESAVADKAAAASREIAEEEKLRTLQIELKALEQAAKQKRIEYEIAARKQKELQITACRSGVIEGQGIEQQLGKALKAGAHLCRIVSPSGLRMEIEISEWDVSSLQPEQSVRFRLRSMGDREFIGKVESISPEPAIRRVNGQYFIAHLYVENRESILQPGMSGVALIETRRRPIRQFILRRLRRITDYPVWLW